MGLYVILTSASPVSTDEVRFMYVNGHIVQREERLQILLAIFSSYETAMHDVIKQSASL